MKKLSVILLLVITITLLCPKELAAGQEPVSAPVTNSTATDPFQSDQAPVIQDVEGLRAEFKQSTQDPESKVIKFEMIIKSGITSDRVKITWTLSGASTFVDKTLASRNITVEAGKTYSIPIEIIPTGYGVTELRAKAEAFKADNSYLVLIRKNFASNASQEILPLTNDYNQAKTLSLIKIVLIVVVVFVILVIIGLLGFKKFVRWLNRDDRK